MNARVLIASVVGGIVAFFLGWLIFGMLMANYYAANTTHYAGLDKIPPDMIALAASNLVYGILLAVVINRWGATWIEGAKVGAWLTLLVMLMIDLFLYAFMNMNGRKLILIDAGLNIVYGAITGAVVGFVLGFRKTA